MPDSYNDTARPLLLAFGMHLFQLACSRLMGRSVRCFRWECISWAMDRARPSDDTNSREHERPAPVRIKDASRKEGGSSSIPVRHGQNGAMSKARTAAGRSSAKLAHKEPPDPDPPSSAGVRALRDRSDMGSNSSLNAVAPAKKERLRSRKSATPQPESKIRPALKKRSFSVEVASGGGQRRASPHEPVNGPANGDGASAGGGGGGGGKTPVRLSAVRHRDRNRLDGGKVSFAPQIEWLAPGDEFAEKAETETVKESAATTEAGAESSRQAASMRKLEEENESLRRAIENYRERERDRCGTRGSVDGTGGEPAPTPETESQDGDGPEDGEEDEVEKAVEASPNGRFLKFDEEIGRGSFKTVYKGLDTTTGVFVAWCELQVSAGSVGEFGVGGWVRGRLVGYGMSHCCTDVKECICVLLDVWDNAGYYLYYLTYLG